MEKVVMSDVIYYEVNLGFTSFFAFDPQELVVRMAVMGLSLN